MGNPVSQSPNLLISLNMNLLLDEQIEFFSEKLIDLEHRQETLGGLSFHECTFKGCDFTETNFSHCTFIDCEFISCELSLITVEGCRFNGVQFRETKLMGINWSKAAMVKRVDFFDCNISYSTFMELDLTRSQITNCHAKETYFAETNLTKANFAQTDFVDSKFSHTDLTRADFTGAKNYFIVYSQNTLNKTKFSMPEALSLLHGLDIVLDDPHSE